MAKTPVVIADDAAFFSSRPQIAVCGLKQTDKPIIDDARRIAFVENRKPHPSPRNVRFGICAENSTCQIFFNPPKFAISFSVSLQRF
jgi:hypothetical protein